MARDALPAAKERRRLLAQKAAGLGQMGLGFLKEGRWGEALECLMAAAHQAGLRELASQALAAGDLFTWRRAWEALGQTPPAQELEQLKDRAQELGKLGFAQSAQAILEPPEQTKS